MIHADCWLLEGGQSEACPPFEVTILGVGTAQMRVGPPYACGRVARLLNHRQLAVDRQQYAIEVMAPAQDQSARRDDTVNPLLARQPRILFDAVEWNFRGAAEDREHRAVAQEIDGIVTPLAVGDHAPVQVQDAIEFEAIERHPAWQGTRSGIARRCAELTWIGFLRHRTHGTLSLSGRARSCSENRKSTLR